MFQGIRCGGRLKIVVGNLGDWRWQLISALDVKMGDS